MTVRRLYVVCEGQTEETFANNVLRDHFQDRFNVSVTALLLRNKLKSASRVHKGGLVNYGKLKKFLELVMAQHHSEETWFTTLIDMYALPADFPGKADAPAAPPSARVAHLELAFKNDVVTDAWWRFTANIQLHEFETLLLVEPKALADLIPEAEDGVSKLAQSLHGIPPEDVNEGPHTAPSKRIIEHIPQYEGLKPVVGPLVTEHLGLQRLRLACPHFGAWLNELEARCH